MSFQSINFEEQAEISDLYLGRFLAWVDMANLIATYLTDVTFDLIKKYRPKKLLSAAAKLRLSSSRKN